MDKASISFIFFIILLEVYAYINISVSYKHEVDLQKSHYSVDGKNLNRIEKRAKELNEKWNRTRGELLIASITFLIFISLIFYKHQSRPNSKTS